MSYKFTVVKVVIVKQLVGKMKELNFEGSKVKMDNFILF